jgi:hypothetical protein
MIARTALRLLAAIPCIFVLAGGLIVYAAIASRALWSPVPRLAVGVLVIITGLLAAAQLWRAHRSAPIAFAIAGLVLLLTFLSLGRLFPIYNSSSETPSALLRYWYPAACALIALLTIAGVWASRVLRAAAGVFAILLIAGVVACSNQPLRERAYEVRRDEYRRVLTARQQRGENVSAADDSALRDLQTLLIPIVGDFIAPGIAVGGRINLETLLPGDLASGLADGMLYQSPDSATRVLVTTHDLMRSWIAWYFDQDSAVSRDPATALKNPDVLTQIFNVDAHVNRYADIPIDGAASHGVVSAMLVARAQDDCFCTPDEIMLSVARGDRIFVIDAPASDTIPVPQECRAFATPGTAAADSVFRRCYAQRVSQEPRFHRLVAQVQRVVGTLPTSFGSTASRDTMDRN